MDSTHSGDIIAAIASRAKAAAAVNADGASRVGALHRPNPAYDTFPEAPKQRTEADDERYRNREQRSKLERAAQSAAAPAAVATTTPST